MHQLIESIGLRIAGGFRVIHPATSAEFEKPQPLCQITKRRSCLPVAAVHMIRNLGLSWLEDLSAEALGQ